ncbi:DNA end protector protein (plasmid) [Klebsiella pneumoniae]|nr:DNA end protector protein [Klebsiella pneumoniae]
MSFIFEFEIIAEEDKPKAPPKRKLSDWVELGIKFRKARTKGVSAKRFADSEGLNYATFTKSMHRYKKQIDDEIERRTAETEARKKRNDYRKKHGIEIINDFRNSLKKITVGVSAAKRQKDSTEWFGNFIKTSIKTHRVAKPATGRLYTFAYDAKYKDTLPYWDRFPLIIFLGSGRSKAGNLVFYGLNLHYAPPRARQEFLEELLKRGYGSTKRLSNKTVLKINWGNVKGMRGATEMIKAYLPSHLKSPLAEIAPKDWAKAVWLPTQQFMSKGKPYGAKKVWSKY